MKKLCGFFDFIHPILIEKDVLGEEYQAIIGGVQVTLILPSIQTSGDELESNLLRFRQSSIVDQHDIPLSLLAMDCGNVIDTTNYFSSLTKAIFIIDIESDEFNDIRQSIEKALLSWLDKIDKYRLIFVNQNPAESFSTFETSGGNHQFFFRNEIKWSQHSISASIGISAVLKSSSPYLSKKDFVKVLELASINRIIELEYSLLIEAFNAMSQGEFRKSVIEAASALEICITNRVKAEMIKNAFQS